MRRINSEEEAARGYDSEGNQIPASKNQSVRNSMAVIPYKPNQVRNFKALQ